MIKKTMIYPIMVLVVAVAVVIVMLTFVVPTFMSMFADMDIDMPKITLAVVAASEFMQARWYIVVAVIVAFVFLSDGLNGQKQVRRCWQKRRLRFRCWQT